MLLCSQVVDIISSYSFMNHDVISFGAFFSHIVKIC